MVRYLLTTSKPRDQVPWAVEQSLRRPAIATFIVDPIQSVNWTAVKGGIIANFGDQ